MDGAISAVSSANGISTEIGCQVKLKQCKELQNKVHHVVISLFFKFSQSTALENSCTFKILI